jgi:hypothetical protein
MVILLIPPPRGSMSRLLFLTMNFAGKKKRSVRARELGNSDENYPADFSDLSLGSL